MASEENGMREIMRDTVLDPDYPTGKPANSGKKPRDRGLMVKRFLVFVLPILVIAVAIGANTAMGALKPKPEEKAEVIKAVPVLTEVAIRENVTLSVTAQGEVQPRTQINIVPQVSGKIAYMSPSFIEGGKFKKGDLLVRIDPAEYQLRVTQAQANVAQAQTVLTREKSESEIARRDWEDLGRGRQASALTLRAPQMAEAEANLSAASAMLGEAELQLSRTSIFAPFTGRVTERLVDAGEYVTIGARLGQVYGSDIMDVRLPLTNADLAQAGLTLGFVADAKTPGIPVTLTANVAGSYQTWSGEIVRTDSGFDPNTRVLFAYVEVKDPFAQTTPLAPGLFVDAEIAGQVIDGTIIIPRAALRGKDEVYVANSDGTLTITQVDLVSSDRDRAVLRSGISPGTAVITSPIRGVADGMKIEVVDRDASGQLLQTAKAG